MLALRAHDRTQPRSCHSPPAQKPAHAIALPPPLALSSPKIVTIKSRRKDALHIALTLRRSQSGNLQVRVDASIGVEQYALPVSAWVMAEPRPSPAEKEYLGNHPDFG